MLILILHVFENLRIFLISGVCSYRLNTFKIGILVRKYIQNTHSLVYISIINKLRNKRLFLCNKLRKWKAHRKHSLHGKIAASVLLKLFIILKLYIMLILCDITVSPQSPGWMWVWLDCGLVPISYFNKFLFCCILIGLKNV